TDNASNATSTSESSFKSSAISVASVPKKTATKAARHEKKVNTRASRVPGKSVDAKENEKLVADNSQGEIATDFLPVGYTSSINLQDGGQIVRVVLPRSTLATFGLPINMDRYHETVKADVLFGADGQARAIRFVQ